MTIHWWSTNKAVNALAHGQISEPESMRYAVAGGVLFVLATYFATWFGGYGNWTLALEFSVAIALTLFGIRVCFNANRGTQGSDFLKRLAVIGVPVGVKLVFFAAIAGLFFGFPYLVTPISIPVSPSVFKAYSFAFVPVGIFIYYWRIAAHLSRLASRVTLDVMPPEELNSNKLGVHQEREIKNHGFNVFKITVIEVRTFLIWLLKLVSIGVISFYLIFGILLGSSESIVQRFGEIVFGTPKPERTASSHSRSMSRSDAEAILNAVSAIKPRIVEYYFSHDRLPRPFDLELPPGHEAYIQLLENGTLEAFGENKGGGNLYWRFIPGADGSQNWDCVSPSETYLDRYFLDCRLVIGYDKSSPVTQEVRVSESLNFIFGGNGHNALVPGGDDRLKALIATIGSPPSRKVVDIGLTGYADTMGNDTSNALLAESRALFVRDTLVAAGIDRSLFSIRVKTSDPKAPDCPASFTRSARISCLSGSRRVDITARIFRIL